MAALLDNTDMGHFHPRRLLGTSPSGAGGPYARLSPLRYCLAGLPVGYQFKNITDADVNNLLLEELIIWTNYEIEVAAYNSAGLGVYSSKVTEWTLQGGGPSSQSQAIVRCAPLPARVGGLWKRGSGGGEDDEGRGSRGIGTFCKVSRELDRETASV